MEARRVKGIAKMLKICPYARSNVKMRSPVKSCRIFRGVKADKKEDFKPFPFSLYPIEVPDPNVQYLLCPQDNTGLILERNLEYEGIEASGTEYLPENRTERGMKNTKCRVGGKSGLGNNF